MAVGLLSQLGSTTTTAFGSLNVAAQQDPSNSTLQFYTQLFTADLDISLSDSRGPHLLTQMAEVSGRKTVLDVMLENAHSTVFAGQIVPKVRNYVIDKFKVKLAPRGKDFIDFSSFVTS